MDHPPPHNAKGPAAKDGPLAQLPAESYAL
jgi:hypothetical protein